MTLRELARRSGISAGQLSRIENDAVASPNYGTIRALAGASGRPEVALRFLYGATFHELQAELPDSAAWDLMQRLWPDERRSALYETYMDAAPGSAAAKRAEEEARQLAFDDRRLEPALLRPAALQRPDT